MLMIRAIVRPEKVDAVLENLMSEGFPAVTKMNVSGRGKQRPGHRAHHGCSPDG
jgi:nitrogen regulatory protein PII 1